MAVAGQSDLLERGFEPLRDTKAVHGDEHRPGFPYLWSNNIRIDAKAWEVGAVGSWLLQRGFVGSGHDETPSKATTSYLSTPPCRSIAGLLKAPAFVEMHYQRKIRYSALQDSVQTASTVVTRSSGLPPKRLAGVVAIRV
jgi:hypothetical protein